MQSVETLTTHARGQNGNSTTPATAEASGRPLEFIEFFNHTSDIVLTIDGGYRITAANDAARTTLPLHWGKILKIGSSILEIFPTHERTRLKALCDSVLRGESAERQHLEIMPPNGNLQHYEVTCYLLSTHPDSSARIAMFMRNITDLYEIQRKQREDAEHALHQAKEQFYKTANTVPGMIYQIVFHPDGTVSYPYVSEGCRALYGVNPEDVMRDASILTKMWHPDDYGEYMRRVEECRRTLKPFDMECRIVLPDGTIKWLRVNSVPELQPDGSLCFYGIRADITAQKQAEAILNQQRLQMNAAADLAKLAFWECDLQKQTFIFNERCYALIGTTAEQEGGYTMSVEKYLGKFVLPEDVPAMLQHLQNVLSNRSLKSGQAMYRIRRPDNGEIRYIKVIYNVERNAEGIPVWLFGPIQDVTEQEETLLALRQSEEKFRKTVSSVPGMVYEFTILPDGTMAMPYVSEGCRELFGVEPEVITKDLMAVWSSMMHPDDIAAAQVAIAESAANLSPFVYEARCSLPSGKNIWTRFYGKPVKRDDGTVLWYGVCVDITELKALEAELKARLKEIQETQKHLIQSEKMSALGQMVAGIAHELNTPIGYAMNNMLIIRDRFRNISSLLRKALEAHDCIYSNQLEQAFAKMQEVAHSPNGTIAELDETIRRTDRLFAGVSSGLEQMANLVKSMRNFSRLDEAEMKKADINEGLRSCLLMIGHQFKDKNIELTTEYGNIPMVDCFPAQLNQVFLNLISNAIHAVEEKTEGKIHVSSSLEEGYVVVRVKDNGKGIPKHIQDKIFDPFFTTKPVGKGTGLGLSICYNIVQKHKGQLYFETTEGVGTTFIVKIPAVDFLEA
jgi:PAS domain S-box-containing protein